MDINSFECVTFAEVELDESPTAAELALFYQEGGVTSDKGGIVVYNVMFEDGPIEEFTGLQLVMLERMAKSA